MVAKRFRDTDIWPDNWKEWYLSLILVSAILALGYALITIGSPAALTYEGAVSVSVVGDSKGAIVLQPYEEPDDASGGVGRGDGPTYARTNRNGQLELNTIGTFTPVFGTAHEMNTNTDIENVFTITNQGNREVAIRLHKHDDLTTGENGEYANTEENTVMFYHTRDDGLRGTPETPLNDIKPAGSRFHYESDEFSITVQEVELDPGESITVSMRIDTSADTFARDNNRGDDLLDSVTVIADTSPVNDPNTEVGDNDGTNPMGD